MARRVRDRQDRVDEVGGIFIGHRHPPAWLMFVIAAIVAWGLYYLITYTVTDTGSFKGATGALRLLR